jgi:hypothetical protein
VGAAPVGLIAVTNGTRIIVANSNRFAAPGAAGTLSVADTAATLADRPALRGLLPAGGFLREFVLAPSGRVLLVTNRPRRRWRQSTCRPCLGVRRYDSDKRDSLSEWR